MAVLQQHVKVINISTLKSFPPLGSELGKANNVPKEEGRVLIHPGFSIGCIVSSVRIRDSSQTFIQRRHPRLGKKVRTRIKMMKRSTLVVAALQL